MYYYVMYYMRRGGSLLPKIRSAKIGLKSVKKLPKNWIRKLEERVK